MWLLFPIVKTVYQIRYDKKFHFKKYEKFHIDAEKAQQALTELILKDLDHPDIKLTLKHHPHLKGDYSTGYLLLVPFNFKRATILNRRAGICKLRRELKIPIDEIKVLNKIIVNNQQESFVHPMLI